MDCLYGQSFITIIKCLHSIFSPYQCKNNITIANNQIINYYRVRTKMLTIILLISMTSIIITHSSQSSSYHHNRHNRYNYRGFMRSQPTHQRQRSQYSQTLYNHRGVRNNPIHKDVVESPNKINSVSNQYWNGANCSSASPVQCITGFIWDKNLRICVSSISNQSVMINLPQNKTTSEENIIVCNQGWIWDASIKSCRQLMFGPKNCSKKLFQYWNGSNCSTIQPRKCKQGWKYYGKQGNCFENTRLNCLNHGHYWNGQECSRTSPAVCIIGWNLDTETKICERKMMFANIPGTSKKIKIQLPIKNQNSSLIPKFATSSKDCLDYQYWNGFTCSSFYPIQCYRNYKWENNSCIKSNKQTKKTGKINMVNLHVHYFPQFP